MGTEYFGSKTIMNKYTEEENMKIIESERYRRQINRFWNIAAGMKNYSKVLLSYFIYMQDHFGPLELKLTEIVEDTGLAYQSAKLALDELVNLGHISIERTDGREKLYKVLI